MIPAAPLVEDYTVPLTELYVQPPMSAFIKPNAFGQGNKHSEKTPVRSYQELFFNNDNIPYKNIYVEANAGYGKTTFTQNVAMTWCQAQKTFNFMNRKFKKKDVDTLKRFEFLFLLHLRDFQGDMCNLDELILKFVSQNLPHKEQFSEQFIAEILQNKTCLVIIDGLDCLNKKNAPTLPTGNAERNVTVPECMRHNALCNLYRNLLLKLGELSFYTLCQKIKESSLVIDGETVLKFLTEQELEFCLKIGLLSQCKDRSLVSVKRYQVYFQHKSVQEFMAAMFITSEWNDGTTKSTIVEICSSLSGILEMENLFVFVCGMNPEIYTCISGELQKNVKRDRIKDQNRTQTYTDEIGTMLAYQSMLVQCFQESVSNGNDNCSIPLQDFVIRDKKLTDDDCTALVKIIDCTLVQTSSGDKAIGLQSLDLYQVTMTHSNIERIYAVINQTTTLTQLKLEYIHCSDHENRYRDCDVTLDLHRLNELKKLHLNVVPSIELHVNPARLEKLVFRPPLGEKTFRASATLLQDLRTAPVLSSLTLSRMSSCQEMIQTIPTLTQLQYLQLGRIDMDDVIPLSPDMTQLEHVVLVHVTMSSAAWLNFFVSVSQLPRSITVQLSQITMPSQEWRELLLSVGQLQHAVTVELSSCYGPSREEWREIVNVIKKTPTLSLLPDLRIDLWWASLTLKNKTV